MTMKMAKMKYSDGAGNLMGFRSFLRATSTVKTTDATLHPLGVKDLSHW